MLGEGPHLAGRPRPENLWLPASATGSALASPGGGVPSIGGGSGSTPPRATGGGWTALRSATTSTAAVARALSPGRRAHVPHRGSTPPRSPSHKRSPSPPQPITSVYNANSTAAVVEALLVGAREAATSKSRKALEAELETLPALADAVRRVYTLADARAPAPSSPAAPAAAKPAGAGPVPGRDQLFQIAYILAHVSFGDEQVARTIANCRSARIAELAATLIERALAAAQAPSAPPPFQTREALLSLSILANLACLNGHALLLAPEVNALELFVQLLVDEPTLREHPLVVRYAIAGVRNLANCHEAAAELRRGVGEATLRRLLAEGAAGVPLDDELRAHAMRALAHVEALAPSAHAPSALFDTAAKRKRSVRATELDAEARQQWALLQKRIAAARIIQRRARRHLLARRLIGRLKQDLRDDTAAGTSREVRTLLVALHPEAGADAAAGSSPPAADASTSGAVDNETRLSAARALASFSAKCSVGRLVEMAGYTQLLLDGTLGLPNAPAALRACGATIIANLAYTAEGRAAAISAGATMLLLETIRQRDKLTGASVNACLAQCAAALQNLSYDSASTCAQLRSAGAPRLFQQLMSFADPGVAEFAAGALTNTRLFAPASAEGRTTAAAADTPADRKARLLLKRKAQRSNSDVTRAAVTMQAAWRGVKARQLAAAERETRRGRLPPSIRKVGNRVAPPPPRPAPKSARVRSRVKARPPGRDVKLPALTAAGSATGPPAAADAAAVGSDGAELNHGGDGAGQRRSLTPEMARRAARALEAARATARLQERAAAAAAASTDGGAVAEQREEQHSPSRRAIRTAAFLPSVKARQRRGTHTAVSARAVEPQTGGLAADPTSPEDALPAPELVGSAPQ